MLLSSWQTYGADDAEKDDFYQQLQDLVNKILRHDITIVMGDMNAQIGGDRSGFEHVLAYSFGKRTENKTALFTSVL